jgi:Putative zinc- or iron-chelating domain
MTYIATIDPERKAGVNQSSYSHRLRVRARQQRTQGEPISCLDGVTGECVTARDTRCTPTEYMDQARASVVAGRSSVPCKGCTACCHQYSVPVVQAEKNPEDLKFLDLVADPEGGVMLRNREDGACGHLSPSGCIVYAHRPKVCRIYDCRATALAGLIARDESTGRSEPAWVFPNRTEEDRLVQVAARYGARTFIAREKQAGREWTAQDAAAFAFQHLRENIALARRQRLHPPGRGTVSVQQGVADTRLGEYAS